MIYTTPLKTASVKFEVRGIWYGVVVGIVGHRLNVKVPRLSGELVYGPLDVVAPNTQQFLVGDLVAVSFVEDRQDDLIVIGRIRTADESAVAE